MEVDFLQEEQGEPIIEAPHPVKRWILRLLIVSMTIAITLFGLVLYAQWNQPEINIYKEPEPAGSVVYSSITLATSTDLGVTIQPTGQTIFDHATQPDLLLLSKDVGTWKAGTLLMYFTDYSTLDEDDPKLSVAYSTNGGQSWSDLENITLHSDIFFDPISPSAVQLEDGSIQLYFTGFLRASGAIAKERKEKTTFSATSLDGLNFTPDDGWRIRGESFYNPEIVWTGTDWQLFIGRGNDTLLNVTDDGGMTFRNVSKPTSQGGSPGITETNDQTLLFACYDGLVRSTSDDGRNFSTTVNILRIDQRKLCDPSPAVLADGTLVLAFSVRE